MTDDAAQLHRALSSDVIAVDWHDELRALRSSDSYGSADHSARTLAKSVGLRVVLVAMKGEGRMEEHHTDSAISVPCLEGRLRFEVAGTTHELSAGQVLVVGEGLPHSVAAVEECAFLLTIGQQHRGEAPAAQD